MAYFSWLCLAWTSGCARRGVCYAHPSLKPSCDGPEGLRTGVCWYSNTLDPSGMKDALHWQGQDGSMLSVNSTLRLVAQHLLQEFAF